MTIKEAMTNIDIVVSGTKMNRQEHQALQESVNLIMTHINSLEERIKEIECEDELVEKAKIKKDK